MSKGARNRSKKNRSDLLSKRLTRTLRFYKDRLANHYDQAADEFVSRMREARSAVPGATQEIPAVRAKGAPASGNGAADLATMNRDELRKIAAEYGIAGRGKMTKNELREAVEEAAGTEG